MLGGIYGARRPPGLKSLILGSAPADVELTVQGEKLLIDKLPEDARTAIYECEAKGDYENPAYREACMAFYKKHMCLVHPFPEELITALTNLEADPTVYSTMMGPSEITVIGSMKDFKGWKEAHKIEVPVLLLNGRYDEVQDVAVAPWFEHIPKVKWVQLSESSHMCHFEERDRYMQLVGDFLGQEKPHF